MNTTYLKAENAADLRAALLAAGVLDDGDVSPPGISVIVVGLISRDTGQTNEDGDPIFEIIPGYHANIYGDLTEAQIDALAPITIPAPATPYVTLWV